MSRYIDADRLKTDFAGTLVALERKPKFDGLQIILIRCVFDMIGKIVDNAPTVDANHILDDTKKVDAVEVVRCGECKYWHETDSVWGTTFGECKRPHPIIRNGVLNHEGWFCADGERKDERVE